MKEWMNQRPLYPGAAGRKGFLGSTCLRVQEIEFQCLQILIEVLLASMDKHKKVGLDIHI